MTREGPSTTTTTTAAAAAEQTLARLADLARAAVQTQASLAKQSFDLARGTLSGDLDRTSAGKAYVEAVSREGARYWRAVGELGVDYATDLVALRKECVHIRPSGDGRSRPEAGHPACIGRDRRLHAVDAPPRDARRGRPTGHVLTDERWPSLRSP